MVAAALRHCRERIQKPAYRLRRFFLPWSGVLPCTVGFLADVKRWTSDMVLGH